MLAKATTTANNAVSVARRFVRNAEFPGTNRPQSAVDIKLSGPSVISQSVEDGMIGSIIGRGVWPHFRFESGIGV
jgi:hypothetical protein